MVLGALVTGASFRVPQIGDSFLVASPMVLGALVTGASFWVPQSGDYFLVASPMVLGALVTGASFLHFFLRSFLWLSGSSDRGRFSCSSFVGPYTNFFRSLCCSVPTLSPESRRVPPILGTPPPPGPARCSGDLSRALAPLRLSASSFDEPSCLSSEGSS